MTDNICIKKVSGLLSAALMLISAGLPAQKRSLTPDDVDGWRHISDVRMTSDGRIVSYEVRPQSGTGELHFRSDRDEKTIPRGCDALLTDDGRYAWFRIRSGDKSVKDSLGCINLRTFKVNVYPSMTSFAAGSEKQPYCAYLSSYVKDGVKCRSLVIPDPSGDEADTLRKVSSYAFSKDGTRLAAVVKSGKDKDYEYSAFLYDIVRKRRISLVDGMAYCSCPSFSDDGKKAVFLTSRDTLPTDGGRCSLMYYDGGSCRELLSQDDCGLEGWRLTGDSAPVLTPDGRRIFFYVSPEPEDIPDEDGPGVEIWRYDDSRTPPQYAFVKKRINTTFRAVLNLKGKSSPFILTDNADDEIRILGLGMQDFALSLDRGPYMITESWTYRNEQDVWLVSLEDGSRRLLRKGLSGFVSASPDGSALVWSDMDAGGIYSCTVPDGRIRCLSESTGTDFFIEDNDRPRKPFPYCQTPLWIDAESCVIPDRYDLWRFNMDGGEPVNITAGEGRRLALRFRCPEASSSGLSASDRLLDRQPLSPSAASLCFTVLEENTMKQGLGRVSPSGQGVPDYFTDTMSFSIAAQASGTLLFKKGSFSEPEDLYVTRDGGKTAVRISDLRSQTDEYFWGKAVQVSWKAYDGTPLQGILYVPESMPEGSSCPMIVYFYERRSETLYDWTGPALSRSRINVPYMVSNGYAVFVPDIVFRTGEPGESAYNCIVSGTEAVCAQFPFIDRANIGIDGQSWGGYQTAYLITRTDMFKAAGAGAPVGNMTSAYGGIRWESGVVRAWQYERDQSRIGKSLWEEGGLELYVRNSPLFFADKVRTPLLIIANDEDGAVPWYQGIELFSALRRLGSPVWMLQYKGEGHNLTRKPNRKDLTIKMSEFFDHYLKGAPEPSWMKRNN